MVLKKEPGTEECLEAIDAMIRKAQEDGGAPIAAAIVDTHGELICYARMDGYPIVGRHQACNEVANHMCVKKAFAGAMRERDPQEIINERRLEMKLNQDYNTDAVQPYHDVMWTMLLNPPGGTSIVRPGEETICGGIGVGGRAPGEPGLQDGDFESVGVKVIQDALCPSD